MQIEVIIKQFADLISQNVLEKVLEALSQNNNSSVEEEEWLTKEQACNMLGICSSTIYLWEKQNYIKAIRFGRRVRFAKSEVERVAKAEHKTQTL